MKKIQKREPREIFPLTLTAKERDEYNQAQKKAGFGSLAEFVRHCVRLEMDRQELKS